MNRARSFDDPSATTVCPDCAGNGCSRCCNSGEVWPDGRPAAAVDPVAHSGYGPWVTPWPDHAPDLPPPF